KLDNKYRYICHAKDHFSKFCWSSPLTSKRAEEVAIALFNIFIIFGPPVILHTDNGKEFTASIIRQLISLWPGIRIINGRPRHPESQGSIEKANDSLERKLSKWMEDEKSTNWTQGLPLATHAMNTEISRVTKHTPYELVF
ncbi:19807_t:CDS:1, partial [Gigaspora margarita]